MKIHYCFFLALSACSIQLKATPPEVDLTFIFAVDSSILDSSRYSQIANQETRVLNQYFVNEKQQPIFRFKMKNYIDYRRFQNMNCPLAVRLNQEASIDSAKVKKEFNQCFRNPNTVYVFIFDAYHVKSGRKDTTSWGFNNNNRPFVLLDWERLNYNQQAALPHEMGHAFGLRHVCASKAKRQDSTNLMASKGNCDGSGGKRNLGFNKAQVKTIKTTFNQLKR